MWQNHTIISKREFTIGGKIKKYRQRLGVSQDVLSKMANLAFHAITKIETGATSNPRIKTVKKIADALGVLLDDLMKLKNRLHIARQKNGSFAYQKRLPLAVCDQDLC